MAAKKSESKSDWKDFLLNAFSNKVISNLRNQLNEFMSEVQERIYETEKIILQKLFATVTLSLGAVFFLIGAVHYLQDYLFWNATQSFSAVGGVLILLSFSMKYFILKNETRK